MFFFEWEMRLLTASQARTRATKGTRGTGIALKSKSGRELFEESSAAKIMGFVVLKDRACFYSDRLKRLSCLKTRREDC